MTCDDDLSMLGARACATCFDAGETPCDFCSALMRVRERVAELEANVVELGNVADQWAAERDALKAKYEPDEVVCATPLHARAVELEAARDSLAELICEAAPLAWAAGGDMDGAYAWEKRAHEVLNKAKYTGEPSK